MLWLASALLSAAPGDVDLGFNPNANDDVFSLAVQPDGKILVGGNFTTLGGQPRNNIARLNADGSLDTSFNPNANSYADPLVLQADGKILVGGGFTTLGGQPRNRIARLNPDGTLDPNFDPDANSYVHSLVLQTDGKILVGGGFTTLGGQPRNRIARLKADGSLDPGFNPDANGSVYCMELQADGKILVGGIFTTLGGQPRNRIAQLNADGSLDPGLNPNANNSVRSLVLQADGKVLMGGEFTVMAGQPRNRLARLNPDGSFDTGFDPNANRTVNSLAVQADGKILVGGNFTTLGEQARYYLARLNPDGSLDTSFNPNANNYVYSLAVQTDGKILLGGNFTTFVGQPRNHIARLENDAASVSLVALAGSQVRWLRGGASPEVQSVSFDLATDGGATWTLLGMGTRIAGGWEGTGLSLPASGHLRARARTTGGYFNGSAGLVEMVAVFPAAAIAVEQPVGASLANGGIRSFGTVLPGSTTNLTFTIGNLGSLDLTGLSLAIDGPDAALFYVTASPTAPLSGPTGSTTFTVQFAPINVGQRMAVLHIASNDPDENPFDIILTGAGSVQDIAVEQPLGAAIAAGGSRDFGSVVTGSSTNLTFTLKNAGNFDLIGITATIDGPDAVQFSIYANPAMSVIGPTGSTTFILRFAPTSTGQKSAVLHIASNDPDENPFDIALTGTGIPPTPEIQITGPPNNSNIPDGGIYDFGSVNVGGILSQTLTIRNLGTADLTGLDTILDGPDAALFSITAKPSPPLSARQGISTFSTTFTVQFLPNSTGPKTAVLRITSNDADENPFDITLTGMGTNLVAGDADPSFKPNASNTVYSLAVQSDGKILVGGAFTNLAGQPRNRIARLNADGSLDTGFDPNAEGLVYSLVVQGDGRILVGGVFTNLAGQPRNRIARLNADGSLDITFDPNADGVVNSLAVQADGMILVGGSFTNLAGQPRNHIARLDANGTLEPDFDPNASSEVSSLVVQADGKILVGGSFTNLAGQPRNRIARLNADGSLDTGFNPDANYWILSLAVQADGKILVAGAFTSLGGQTRNYIARLNPDGSVDPGFNPNASSQVNSLALQTDGKILMGGYFTTLGGQPRNRIARLNNDGSLDSSFNPNANNPVFSLVLQADGKVLVGGTFATLGGQARNSIARLENDAASASLAAPSNSQIKWLRGGASPEAQTVGFDLSTDGGITWTPLGIGTRIAGGWELSELSLPASGYVRARAWTTGGYYNGSGGLVEMVAVFPAADIAVEQPAGMPIASGGIRNFGTVFVGGATNLNFTIRNLGSLDLTNLNFTIDGPDATFFSVSSYPAAPVSGPDGSANFAIQFVPRTAGLKMAVLHIGSNDESENPFDISLSGTGINFVAGDVDTSFNPAANNWVYSLGVQTDRKILVGGDFTTFGGPMRNRIARLNADGSLDLDFNPTANATVYCVAVQADGKILVGGVFTNLAGQACYRIGRLNADGSIDPAFNPGVSSAVYSLAIQADGKILVGRNGIVRLNADGSLDSGFNPNANNVVQTVAMQVDGKILVGGWFTSLGGQTRNYIARLNADGSLDTSFNPNANNWIYSLVVQVDGKILVGGRFTTLGGQTRNNIARLNADGSLDTSFNPNANNWVYSLVVQVDGKILVGGRFTTLGGQTRNYFARLNPDGSLDSGYNPGASNYVQSLALQADGKILVGGAFTNLAGQTRNYIARLENDPAPGTLAVSSSNRVQWLRGGTAPEVQSVSFDLSTDGGVTWTPLGAGTRITGGWELNGLSLPASGRVRARAWTSGGYCNGSAGIVEMVATFPAADMGVEQPAGTLLVNGGIRSIGAALPGGATNLAFTIRNLGSLDLTGLSFTFDGPDAALFSVASNPTTVIGGLDSSATFTVQFAPTNVGPKMATLHIASNDPDENPFNIILTGASGLPQIAVEQPFGTAVADGGSRDFGTVSSLTFILKNAGNFDLAGFNFTIDGSDAAQFSVTAKPATTTIIGLNSSTTFTVRFAPTNSGPRTAVLHIASNDPDENSFDIILTGTGLPEVVVEQPIGTAIVNGGSKDFGSIGTGFNASLNFYLKNTGNLDLTGIGIMINGPDAAQFAVTTNPATSLTVSNGTSFTVQFASTSLGLKTASLHITNNDSDKNPFDINLSGTGISPAPEIAVARLPAIPDIPDGGTNDFGLANLGGPVSHTFTVRNIGYADLTGLDISIDGDDANLFSVTANPIAPVNYQGGTTTFTVRFAPTNTGPKAAVLHIASNDADENPFDIILTGTGRIPVTGDVDTSFNPDANFSVYTSAEQLDGKILVGGYFSTMGGQPRNNIARLNSDGSLDNGFNPNGGNTVYCLAAQTDGKILVGGYFSTMGGQARNHIARLNVDGSLDSSFNPNPNERVYCLALQADGKILVGGYFTSLAGQTRNYIARLNSDGSLDNGFNPNGGYIVRSLALQADGKILVGGWFIALVGQPRNHIARLNADGSLDNSFNPNADWYVYSFALQADGKILVGGAFSTVGGQSRNHIARLNADGSLDNGFNPNASDTVSSLAVQADGKILVGGAFTNLAGQPRYRIGRLNVDGSLDTAFDPNVSSSATLLALQADGKILVGGHFTSLGGLPRNNIARLVNDAATQNLTVPNNNRVQWLRGGAAPEAQDVWFEHSTDVGSTWTALGRGSRIVGGWELSGLNLPGGLVRARARIVGDGSSGLVEAIATVPGAPALGNPFFAANQFRFVLPTMPAKVYQVQFTPTISNASLWETVRTVNGDGTVIEVSVTPASAAGFYRVVVGP